MNVTPGEMLFAITVFGALVAALTRIFTLGGDVRSALDDIATLKKESAKTNDIMALHEASIETRMNVNEGAVSLLQALEKDRKDALREMRGDIEKRFDKLEIRLETMQTLLATKT